jgi:hypothetical protein
LWNLNKEGLPIEVQPLLFSIILFFKYFVGLAAKSTLKVLHFLLNLKEIWSYAKGFVIPFEKV